MFLLSEIIFKSILYIILPIDKHVLLSFFKLTEISILTELRGEPIYSVGKAINFERHDVTI